MDDLGRPQERYPEISVLISLQEVSRRGDPEWGYLEDRVVHVIMDVFGRPQGSYPESFVSLSLFLAEI